MKRSIARFLCDSRASCVYEVLFSLIAHWLRVMYLFGSILISNCIFKYDKLWANVWCECD